MNKEAVLALGSNLLNKKENIENAIKAIGKLPQTEVEAISQKYLTEPFMVAQKQEKYLNCCIKIETELCPEVLLGACLGIESAMGRKRPFKNAPRIIDIDMIFYEDEIKKEKNLTLPHPEFSKRAFVLLPLMDLYPSGMAFGMNLKQHLLNVDTSTCVLYN